MCNQKLCHQLVHYLKNGLVFKFSVFLMYSLNFCEVFAWKSECLDQFFILDIKVKENVQ